LTKNRKVRSQTLQIEPTADNSDPEPLRKRIQNRGIEPEGVYVNTLLNQEIKPSPTDFDITIQNVVATATFGQKFNLDDIEKAFVNVEYRPKRFPGLVFRLKRPKTTILIFRTGKMVCTGARSSRSARSAIKKVVKQLKEKRIIIINKPRTTIQNIVASANLQNSVDLEMAAELLENVMYEPEQFPGLIHRMKDPKTVILVFVSGKVIITGGKSEKTITKAVNKLYNNLDNYLLFF
jgi:transcription initiation factor TFIID TATA-box-binding protein